MKQFKLLLVGLMVFAFISCDTEEIAKTTTELLTQKVWTFDIATGNADNVDLVNEINADWEGLTLDFKTDGTYTVVSNNGTDTGVWKIDSGEDNITLDEGTTDQMSFFIYSISETEMHLQMNTASGIIAIYFK